MTREKALKLRQLKSKNNKIKSSYLHLCECNRGRARALVTLTIPAMTAKELQLLLIKEIKNYFSKRLQNLKCDIQYFSIIELGKYKTNPHLHIQLFYNKADESKVEKAYQKTIDKFSLLNQRCKFAKEIEEISLSSSFNYIIKEFDNLKLNDNEILALDKARKKLKQGNTKYIQFFSKSRPQQPHLLYKTLWFKYNLNYMNVNALMNGYATRLKGYKLIRSQQINKLPYILFKNGAIQVNSFKLYKLILLTLLYLYMSSDILEFKMSQKILYYNKRKRYSKNKRKTQKGYYKVE